MTAYRSIRRGITLIEMMVAMALALGIMLILTESFKMALDFVRGAHSTGELISQLNSAGILLTRDLQTQHFIPDTTGPTPPTPGPKLSDQRYDLMPAWTPPTGGFFKIVAPNPGLEPLPDPHGFNITAPATNHVLHFTSIMPLGTDVSSFTATVGGTTYSSQAAEIAYFLVPMGKKTSVTASGLPLHNLIRRQRLVAFSSDEQTSLTAGIAADPFYSEVASVNGATINTLATVRTNRLTPLTQLPQRTPPPDRFGEDIVVSNVLSFEIQADWTPNTTAPYTTVAPRSFGPPGNNTDAPYDFLPGTFDTAAPTNGNYLRVKSLQITIRVYDPRVKTTRQNTWKFAM